MISNSARFVVGVVTLATIGVFVSSTSFAQHGPGRHDASAGQREPDQITNLTSAWTLNTDLSDDVAKAMQGMHGDGNGRLPSGGTGGHGPGRHGGGGHGGMDPAQMQVMQARLRRAMEAPARLTITQMDGSITFTDGDGRSQTLTTNNRKEKLSLDNRTVDVRTRWDGGRLVKETSLDDGLKLSETYSLVTERRQLHVMAKLEGSRLPQAVHVRRVYDATATR